MSPDLLQENFILDPPPGRQDPRPIRGVITRPAEPGPTGAPFVLVVHGFKGFLRWGFFPELQERLARRGLAAVAFNLSGSGVGEDLATHEDDDGFEANTYTREVEDVAAVRAAVEAGRWTGIDPRAGGIVGHSRGGGAALMHASTRPGLRAAVTWASIDSVVRWDEATREQWRRDGVVHVPNARTGHIHRLGLGLLSDGEAIAGRGDITGACAALQLPVLLLHGEEDQAVPVDAMDRLASAIPAGLAEAHRIPGTGHTFGAVHPFAGSTPELDTVLDRTLAFLERHLQADPA